MHKLYGHCSDEILDAVIELESRTDTNVANLVQLMKALNGGNLLNYKEQQVLRSYLWPRVMEKGAVCIICLNRYPYNQWRKFCEECEDAKIRYRDSVLQGHDQYIYALRDEEGHVVYVGRTTNPLRRFGEHFIEKPIVDMFVIFGLSGPDALAEISEYETAYIEQAHPALNKKGIKERKEHACELCDYVNERFEA
jgi:hypothetical protein